MPSPPVQHARVPKGFGTSSPVNAHKSGIYLNCHFEQKGVFEGPVNEEYKEVFVVWQIDGSLASLGSTR